MTKRIACVVEGHGEVEAITILVRRIADKMEPPENILFTSVIRTPKSKLIRDGELERAVELAVRSTAGRGGILIVIDADDDCPATIGPILLRRATKIRANLPIAVVVAKREFESWFIASAESLANHAGLPADLQSPADPENIRGAKEWLSQRMRGTRSYSPTLDQPSMAQQFDLELALRADSFEKFHREARRLILESPAT